MANGYRRRTLSGLSNYNGSENEVRTSKYKIGNLGVSERNSLISKLRQLVEREIGRLWNIGDAPLTAKEYSINPPQFCDIFDVLDMFKETPAFANFDFGSIDEMASGMANEIIELYNPNTTNNGGVYRTAEVIDAKSSLIKNPQLTSYIANGKNIVDEMKADDKGYIEDYIFSMLTLGDEGMSMLVYGNGGSGSAKGETPEDIFNRLKALFPNEDISQAEFETIYRQCYKNGTWDVPCLNKYFDPSGGEINPPSGGEDDTPVYYYSEWL